MNVRKVLFNYVVEHESYAHFPQLICAEQALVSSLTDKQKELFESYLAEYNKYYNDRIYYYFCKGIDTKL